MTEKENSLKTILTKREYEVLELMAQGLSNDEIMQKLIFSKSTVKSHLVNIYSKLYISQQTRKSSTQRVRAVLRFLEEKEKREREEMNPTFKEYIKKLSKIELVELGQLIYERIDKIIDEEKEGKESEE